MPPSWPGHPDAATKITSSQEMVVSYQCEKKNGRRKGKNERKKKGRTDPGSQALKMYTERDARKCMYVWSSMSKDGERER
jgi:hypothetical protein